MIDLVFLLAIIIIAGILIARFRRKTRFGSSKDGVSVLRHLWLYLISFLALGTFASGVGLLLNLVFDLTIKNPYVVEIGRTVFDKQQLSLGIAMVVIGGPLWFVFWRTAQRHVRDNAGEAGATVRKFFLSGILLITGLMAVIAASDLVVWLLSGALLQKFPSESSVFFIIGVSVWVYHWYVSEKEGYPSSEAETLRRWYVYVLAGFGLVWLVIGIVQLVDTAVATSSIWGDSFVPGKFWEDPARFSITHIVFGGLVWYFHWFHLAAADFDSTLRQVYFYLLTIAGAAISILVASTVLLYRVLDWAFGGVAAASSSYFQFLGWTLPLIIVGIAVWAYHLQLTQDEASSEPEKRQSVQRISVYLMSFLGLGMLVIGLSFALGLCVDLIRQATETTLILARNWWQDQLALSLALLVVGIPIWIYYWDRILQRVHGGNAEEQRSLSRRIYLYLIVGASIITIATDLVNIIYQLLNGLLQDAMGVTFLRGAKWSLQTLFVVIPVFWYHWRILRNDQRYTAEGMVERHDLTLLVSASSEDLIARLETELGHKVKLLYQLGDLPESVSWSEADVSSLIEGIKASPYEKILLVTFNGKMMAFPYEDKG